MRFAGAHWDDRTGQIWIREIDGGERQITHFSGGAYNPSWAPDGSRIVFQRLFARQHKPDQLYTMKADGSDVRKLTSGCVAGRCLADDSASYSPDSTQIGFVRVRLPLVRRHLGPRETPEFAAHVDVMTVPAAGGRAKLVKRFGVDPQTGEGGPSWSPDGKRLVLPISSLKHPTKHAKVATALHVLDIKSGALRRITPWSLGAARPAWSPDGNRIVFHSEGGHSPHIYVVNSDGTGLRLLYTGVPTAQSFAHGPVFSPDGAQIAFVAGHPGRGAGPQDIYAMNADGSAVHPLVSTANRAEDSPSWAPAK